MDVAAERIIKAVVSVRARTAAALEAMEKAATAAAAPAPLTKKHYLSDTYRFSCEGALVAAYTLEAGSGAPAWTPVAAASAPGVDAAALAPAVTTANKACAAAVVLSETVAHPQGGGQPSDKGLIVLHTPCGKPSALFAFTAVAPTPNGGGIAHFGAFIPLPEAPTPEGLAAAADAVTETPAAGAALCPPPELPGLRSAAVYLNRPHRKLAARLHSAGHLLDLAVRHVQAALGGGKDALPPLVPSKGYHFADGPYVEYIGSVSAEQLPLMPRLITEECAKLLAPEAAAATGVVTVPAGDAAGLAAAGVEPASVAHLPAGSDVRIVSIGAPDNSCPCGGTHVPHASDIGRITVTGFKTKKNVTKVTYSIE